MNEPAFQSATELLKSIREKRVGSGELLELYINRYKRLNPKINAIVATDLENAHTRAKEADEALGKGKNWGRLHGLPITIKDSTEVVGMPCTSGAPELKDHLPTRNADVVQILLDAGAIVFGKTNLPAQDFQSFNEVYGQTNNPWNLARVSGGSSGGSAAALAAGLTGLEIGGDIGGSIRTPSHFCGTYGHKPSFKIVLERGHIPPPPGTYPGEYLLDWDMAVIGPMARSAKDLDLVMDLIVIPEKPQQKAIRVELPAPRKTKLKDCRIGLWIDDPAFPVDTNVADCIQWIADELGRAGAQVVDKRPDIDFTYSHETYVQLMFAHSSASQPQEIIDYATKEVQRFDENDESKLAPWIRGMTMLYRNWSKLNYQRLLIRQKWADFFNDFDMLLCPAAPVTAFRHDHSEYASRVVRVNGQEKSYAGTLVSGAGLASVSYLPATMAPVGLAKDSLPVGVQIVGPNLEDRTPIHVATLIEETVGGFSSPTGFE